MTKKLTTFLMIIVGILSIGVFALQTTNAGNINDQSNILEKRVNANLMRIRVNDEWHELPMIGLSDRLCESKHKMFRRYCQ